MLERIGLLISEILDAVRSNPILILWLILDRYLISISDRENPYIIKWLGINVVNINTTTILKCRHNHTQLMTLYFILL